MSTSQFDLNFSGRLTATAQEGMAQADANASPLWKRWFDDCVMAAAKKKAEITSDDVLSELEALPNPPSTHNLGAIGSAMVRAAKDGLLERTERLKRSQRPEKNGNLQRVWRSVIFQRAELKA